ncbi:MULTISPECIES: AEC family transporter [Leptolyngbya]|uniref:Auxin efflux carrier n=3 Tax=Leptolyngbya boryana TaxID=1184 RepID=A0A1Z4JBN9_LEPBY|nr:MULTISPECIES: AEC family transporter [Leptolyngbya]BAS59452.1 auxin efflux carrier family protein [Leptolyngbya boryana IAM M-101]BAY54205.1 auxin efflux carrier [Leptolyngbya boryana NIES-2135]MCY6490419.1 AEC family transporter [Leptolyngbya sp. GGD]ULP31138.1 AEC family transporter [Leptolyngbya boryana IU 594]WNZ43853.1 AEC family transporter [Leptolyngbya boryana CZ1]
MGVAPSGGKGMIGSLVHAYTPLILWTGVGALLFRFLPESFPRFLGRSLYWVGVPWQIFALVRETDFSSNIGIVPAVTIATLGTGLTIAWLALRILIWLKTQVKPAWLDKIEPWFPPLDRASQGTFVIAATIGNTGFVGLGLIPALIGDGDLSWAVFFSVTQNLVGTFGVGVLVASHYGRSETQSTPLTLLRDILTVPTLWAFAAAYFTQSIAFPNWAETLCQSSLLFVIPASFLLMGMRLIQLNGIDSLKAAAVPVALKAVILPSLVAIAVTLLGLNHDARLSLIIMAGVPSAFASLILAEEYNLDHNLAASSIALSTIAILVTIPIWLVISY